MVRKIKKNKTKSFQNSFIHHILKKGKKQKAYKLVYDTLALIKNITQANFSSFFIFNAVFDKAAPAIEMRSVRVRRSSYLVPFPLNLSRQMHLVSLWILDSLSRDKRKIPFKDKLSQELLNILQDLGETVQKKKTTYQLAQKNRSNMHYRWY